jgi:hypothetical protein
VSGFRFRGRGLSDQMSILNRERLSGLFNIPCGNGRHLKPGT